MALEFTMIYVAFNLLAFIGIVIMSIRKSLEIKKIENKEKEEREEEEENDEFETSGFEEVELEEWGLFWVVLEQIQNRTYIFSAFLVHVWDSGSDLGVLATFYKDENARTLFWSSLMILVTYRIFSAFSMKRASRGWRAVVLQALDVQLFVDVYRSSVDARPTDQLYWIRAMEAVLESSPQCLLQFVYLYSSYDPFVWFSLFVSLASIIFSLLHYDDIIFIYVGSKWYAVYTVRFLFRLCEILGRTMVLALLWNTWPDNGAFVIGLILLVEFTFYAMLTQMSIPPWALVAFLVTNIDLNLTFEGREGAATKKLDHNILYQLVFKPISQMFTTMTEDDKTDYAMFVEDYKEKMEAAESGFDAHTVNNLGDLESNPYYARMKRLLIAPAHYVWRFLESAFWLFIVLLQCVRDSETETRVLHRKEWFLWIATLSVICTPVLYTFVRYFADESRTLERNLIAMVYEAQRSAWAGAKEQRENMKKLTKEVRSLINAGAKLTQTDFKGNTVIHAICETDMGKVLADVISQRGLKAPLRKKNNEGFTPAMVAAMNGSLDCLMELSKVLDLAEEKHSALGHNLVHLSARANETRVIEWIAGRGGELQEGLQQVVRGRMNACHTASYHNSAQALEALIHFGVDPSARVSNADNCAVICAERGNVRCLKVLWDSGSVDMEETGEFLHTPFYRAAINDHSSTMWYLAKTCKVKVDIVDRQMIHVSKAACSTQSLSALECLAKLRVSFAYCREFINCEDSFKLTLLMLAAMNAKALLCIHLIRHGARPNYQNRFGETAAHFAASVGNLDILKILKKAGAKFKIKNKIGETVLDKAQSQGRGKCAKFIKLAIHEA